MVGRNIFAFALLVLLTEPAIADGPPYTLGSFADAGTVAQVFGSARFTMDNCTSSAFSVRVDVDRYNLASDGTLDAAKELLRQAIVYAWQQCPWQVGDNSENANDVAYIVVNGNIAVRADTLLTRSGFGPYDPARTENYTVSGFQWANYQDNLSAQRNQVVSQAASANWDDFWSLVTHLFWIAVVGSIAIWVVLHWEMFARWYYWMTPHPAEELVHSAVGGGVIDGKVFAALLRPVPGNRIEREVRARQAQALEALARQTEAGLRKRAEEAKRQLAEEAAFRSAQRGMHDATVDAQLAKARADLLEKLADSLRQSAETR